MDMITWTWLHGHDYMDMITWTWLHGHDDMDMMTWTWWHGHDDMDMMTWTWLHGHDYMDNYSEHTKNLTPQSACWGNDVHLCVAAKCHARTCVAVDILIGGSPVGGSSTNNYANTRVLSQCLLPPAHTIGNENGCTRISAHVLWWYAIVAGNWTMHWLCCWNKFRVAIWLKFSRV